MAWDHVMYDKSIIVVALNQIHCVELMITIMHSNGENQFPSTLICHAAQSILHDAWCRANLRHDIHTITWHATTDHRVTKSTGRNVSQVHTVIQQHQHGKNGTE